MELGQLVIGDRMTVGHVYDLDLKGNESVEEVIVRAEVEVSWQLESLRTVQGYFKTNEGSLGRL